MAGECTFCLTLSLFVEVLVPSQDRKRSYKCVLEVPILHLSMIFFIGCFNCSDSVVFLFLSFLLKIKRKKKDKKDKNKNTTLSEQLKHPIKKIIERCKIGN
jgi:hypothetical protein